MKTAAKILGIVGGAIGILVSFNILLVSVMGERFDTDLTEAERIFNSYLDANALKLGFSFSLASILGIAGGALVNKKKIASGALMIAGAALYVINIIDFTLLILCGIASIAAFDYAFIYVILLFMFLLLGGIFALVPEKNPEPPKVAEA